MLLLGYSILYKEYVLNYWVLPPRKHCSFQNCLFGGLHGLLVFCHSTPETPDSGHLPLWSQGLYPKVPICTRIQDHQMEDIVENEMETAKKHISMIYIYVI